MIKCPVCGLYEFSSIDDYDSCDVCKWQNDNLQLVKPDYWGGANELSLNDYRALWRTRDLSVNTFTPERSLKRIAAAG